MWRRASPPAGRAGRAPPHGYRLLPRAHHFGESRRQVRIELRSGGSDDGRDRGVLRLRMLIAVGGGHRLVGLADLHDPREPRNLLARELAGIAAAVVPLVMTEHGKGD